jgi:hypothetical protein
MQWVHAKLWKPMFFEEMINFDHYIHLILIPLLNITDRNSVLVLYLGQCHGPHSKFLSECTRRGVFCMVDNSYCCLLELPI